MNQWRNIAKLNLRNKLQWFFLSRFKYFHWRKYAWIDVEKLHIQSHVHIRQANGLMKWIIWKNKRNICHWINNGRLNEYLCEITDILLHFSQNFITIHVHWPPIVWNHPTRSAVLPHSWWKSTSISILGRWQCLKYSLRPSWQKFMVVHHLCPVPAYLPSQHYWLLQVPQRQ